MSSNLLSPGGGYGVLRPVCGAPNQLIAALSFLVATVYWLGFKRPKWYTLLPGIFLLIVTETALVYQLFRRYIPLQDWLLTVISSVLMVPGFIVVYEVYWSLRKEPEVGAEPAQATG